MTSLKLTYCQPPCQSATNCLWWTSLVGLQRRSQTLRDTSASPATSGTLILVSIRQQYRRTPFTLFSRPSFLDISEASSILRGIIDSTAMVDYRTILEAEFFEHEQSETIKISTLLIIFFYLQENTQASISTNQHQEAAGRAKPSAH